MLGKYKRQKEGYCILHGVSPLCLQRLQIALGYPVVMRADYRTSATVIRQC